VTTDRRPAARDLVVYASGGGMRGVFGAGALHALAGMGVRDRVRGVYGISAGALNAAQFALGTTMGAMEWYLYHVIEHGILAKATAVSLLRGEDMIDLTQAERVLADERLAAAWLDTFDRTPAEMAEALADPLTLVLRPDEKFAVHFATTDTAVLAHGFWLGYRAVLARRDQLRHFLGG
jgi:predicted acylesterase/phospholipase RssA